MLTSAPTGLRRRSSVAVSGPSTTTDAASATSSALKNRPLDSVRARTDGQSVVVPTTEEVQFVVPYVSDCEPEMTGATALMSGATTAEERATASAIVNVVADPNPPRTPAEDVALPGETMSKLLPSAAIRLRTSTCAPWPRPTVRMTAAMPMRMPSMVRIDRSRWDSTPSSPVRTVSTQFMRVLRAARRPVQASRAGRRGCVRRGRPPRRRWSRG